MADRPGGSLDADRTGTRKKALKLGKMAGRVCMVGGRRIMREAVECLLAAHRFLVPRHFPTEDSLADFVSDGGAFGSGVVLLVLAGNGPFKTFHFVRELLDRMEQDVPVVVLAEHANRGQVYAALRLGAKAYVNMDAEPEQLVTAMEMAACGKVYLAPDAAELLVSDVSAAIEPSHGQRLPAADLSRREAEVVQLLCEGLSSKEIGRRLHISSKTVENHRYNIYRKCEVESIAGLMRLAIQRGIVSL